MKTIFERLDMETLADDVKAYIHIAMRTHRYRKITIHIEYPEDTNCNIKAIIQEE